MTKYRLAHDFVTHVHVRYMLLTTFSQAGAAYLLHVYYISDNCRHPIDALGDYCISRHVGLDDAKCIVVTRVCVSVCLYVRGRMSTLLHGPGCNLGEW